jgi:hypothetical protein
VIAGNLSSLEDNGTRDGGGNHVEECYSAQVYIEADILEACSLVDIPGFSSDNITEQEIALQSVYKNFDTFFFLSPFVNAYNAEDIIQLGQIVSVLPSLNPDPDQETVQKPLSDLFLIISHCDNSKSTDVIKKAKEKIAERLYKTLFEGHLSKKHNISLKDIENRLFPFYAERADLVSPLVEEINSSLKTYYPEKIEKTISSQIGSYKKRGTERIESLILNYNSYIEHIDNLKCEVEKMKNETGSFNKSLAKKKKSFIDSISLFQGEALEELGDLLDRFSDSNFIRKNIVSKFDDYKEAKEYISGALSSEFNRAYTSIIESKSERINNEIDSFVGGLQNELSTSLQLGDVNISLDVRAAFIGGLASAGVYGAFSVWMASLGGLGGYIAVGQVASLLSVVGISVGGTAASAAAIAALGGPITVALGLAVFAGFTVWRLTSSSWEDRLAKKVVKLFPTKSQREKFMDAMESWFDETLIALDSGMEEVIKERQQYIDDLDKNIESGNWDLEKIKGEKELAEKKLETLEKIQWVGF